jgi:phosphoribosylformimino-5-aminoimidazole carboxamide ribotide isomerase
VILFPAIDLKEGACVRLLRGEMDQATVFNQNPPAQARAFADAGAQWLHVVDLDGAFSGRPENAAAVEAIVAALDIPVQLGGGVRDEATIERWLTAGIARVILGTAAAREPTLVKAACARWPGQIAIGIDARDGTVAVEGWAETADLGVDELALRFEDAGASAIIHTDIARDGAMAGMNVEATAALAARLTTPVIASGGVTSLDDLRAVKAAAGSGIVGVIAGRALYDGRIDLAQALSLLGE